MLSFKVTGKFRVYDRNGVLMTDKFFLNKIFDGNTAKDIRRQALDYINEQAALSYGNNLLVEQASDLILKKHERKTKAPAKKRKIRVSTPSGQVELFPKERGHGLMRIGSTVLGVSEEIWKRNKHNFSDDDLKSFIAEMGSPHRDWAKKELKIRNQLNKRKN